MTYLLEFFLSHNKLHIYLVCISLKDSLSFMFDDFDTINLAPRQICLSCIMLNTKNGNK